MSVFIRLVSFPSLSSDESSDSVSVAGRGIEMLLKVLM